MTGLTFSGSAAVITVGPYEFTVAVGLRRRTDTDTTFSDRDRIRIETGDHGDLRTVHPRLVCTDCESFVYLVHPRGFNPGAVRAECSCCHGDPTRGDLPESWVEIQETRFVGDGGDADA